MSKSVWDVVVVGSANTDFLVQGQELPRAGETVQGDLFQEAAGGKGANQAVAAARLGARVALVANVGKDERGDHIVHRLSENGVDTSLLTRDEGAHTGVALVVVDQAGQKSIVTALGANRRLAVPTSGLVAEAIASARVMLAQLEVPLDTVRTAVSLAHRAGVCVVLDTAPALPLPDDLLREVDVIRSNAREAEALTQVPVLDRGSASWAAELLMARGVGSAAIQAGNEGDLLVWHEGSLWMPRLPVKTIDETGAGDAFSAALAVALAEGRTLSEAGPFANATAALATTALGAQAGLPSRQMVTALLAQFRAQQPLAVPASPP